MSLHFLEILNFRHEQVIGPGQAHILMGDKWMRSKRFTVKVQKLLRV
jgi:hypothetical protein